MTKALALKAGTLIEDDEASDKQKMPSQRQLLKLEHNFDKLPTSEILRRVYKRHSTGIWQTIWVLTIAAVVWTQLS